jgi:hypothetical protein
MSRSMDQLTVMWEEILPRKGIKMIREAKFLEIIPHIHLVGIRLWRNCLEVTLGQVFIGRRKRDTHIVL